MCSNHSYQSTAAPGWRQCTNCGRVERLVHGQWQLVEPVKKRRKSRDEYEWEMLNTPYAADYSDHGKASGDLKNYWR